MTKIEVYNIAKDEAQQMEKFLSNITDSSCDKKGVKVTLSDSYLGWYGRSSCGSWGDVVCREMKWQMEHMLVTLAKAAAERLSKIAEDKRLAAKEEAEAILKETASL